MAKAIKCQWSSLTARGNWQEKVEGFKAGTDDYIGKPFQIEELLARISAVLKRSSGVVTGQIYIEGIKLDGDTQTIMLDNGQAATLTGTEFRLLRYFMLHSGHILSKTVLTEHVYEYDEDKDSNVIEVFVNRLRQKVGVDLIQTRRGQGYSVSGLILLLLVQRLIILSAALKPLRVVQDNMAKLARGETDHVEIKGPDEIAPLINELNRLLVGMERKSRRSRESLGNLAHALKTQLTLLNQIAEREEINVHPEVYSSIYAATETISHIVERELKRGRLIGDTQLRRRVDLEAEVAQLVHTLRLLYSSKAFNIIWEIAPETQFFGDQEDLLEMLGNLLDNACKWCRNNVSLTVTDAASAKAVTFVVEDDGPGCAIDELDMLTRRGFRADESKPGSGLGLAIAHDIMESYGGYLVFGRSAALSGLRVEARFIQKN